jgi:hypothetical protein
MKGALSFLLNVPAFNAQSPKTIAHMIIAYLGRNVKEYREHFLQCLASLVLVLRCPVCDGIVTFHDSYDRHVHIGDIIEWIIIHRVKCNGECGGTHAIIPDFIKPYKHYSACDIELALRDMEDGISAEKVETAASVSTLKRWMAEFREKGHQVAGALRSLLYKLFEKTVNELIFTGLNIFCTLEKVLAEFPDIESNNLAISEANLWLTNHMAGVFL